MTEDKLYQKVERESKHVLELRSIRQLQVLLDVCGIFDYYKQDPELVDRLEKLIARQLSKEEVNKLPDQYDAFEDLKDTLNEYWVLDWSEYSILKDLVTHEIDRLDKILETDKSDSSKYEEQEVRNYYADKHLRDFYINMKSKIDYIISKGLCRQHKQKEIKK